MDDSLKQAIVVRSQFAQVSLRPGVNVKNFVSGYMFRADADEPLIINDADQSKYLNVLSKLNSPDDQNADKILNHRLHYNGIGFDKDKLSLSRDEQLDYANQAQHAYDTGRSVKQMIITFDTQWLREHGLLDDDTPELLKRGDLRGKVDQRRLRTAVQDGMNRMFEQSTMHDPQMAAAIQTDTTQVHVHLAVWDQDETVKNDHGKILAREKNAIRTGIVDSLRLQPQYINEVHNLRDVAQSTQQMARFKRNLLKKELKNSAIRLDQVSLHEYVDNLSRYDQKTLTDDQREQLARSIQQDWRQNGRLTTRSHKLSYGQRRKRRQVHAMIRATGLRHELGNYQKALGAQQASKESRVVYDAMAMEAKRQFSIVEKYRAYQRPRVNAIYTNRQDELNARQHALLNRRQMLLPQLSQTPLRTGYVRRLLRRQGVMSNLKQQFPHQPLSKTDVYQDLMKAQDDETHVLSPKTVHAVTKAVDASQKDDVQRELTRNQKINVDTMSPQQRLWLSQYEQDVNEYEFDAVAYGGLNIKQMQLARPDDTMLLVPDATHSIYERDSSKHDPDIMGVDFDQIVNSGPLKPAVELSVRKMLTQRYQRLQSAHDYFEQTDQESPKWLKEAQANLGHQYEVMDRINGPVARPDRVTETTGYEIEDQPLDQLVDKHIQEVDDLQR